MRAHEIGLAIEGRERVLQAKTILRLRREVPVSMGEGRMDVLAIDGKLRGFEVKSGSDSLTRLSRQISIYNRVVDEAVLVVERRYPDRLLLRLPSWWGLWSAESLDGECRLEELRAPGENPDPDPLALAQLLWRNEALELLKIHDHHHGLARANRWQLWRTVVAAVPFPLVQAFVRETLRARQDW